MALEFLETLKEAITAYTGLSPTTFFTVIVLGLAVYYAVSGIFADHRPQQRSRGFEEEAPPLPPPVQLGEISEEELKGYDGEDSKKPLLMAIKGQIYDVSQSRMFYGPGGPYALFAGKDASRALAKMSFEEKDLNGDLTGLGPFELEALQDWEYKFMSKYVKVGSIKKPEPESAPESSSITDQPGESTLDQHDESTGIESTVVKPTESGVTEPADSAESGVAEPADSTVVKPSESTVAEPGESSVVEPSESTRAKEDVHAPSENAAKENKE